MHKHRCPRCRTIWRHSDMCAGDDAAHTCPNPGCGGESWSWYEGSERARFENLSCTTLAVPIEKSKLLKRFDFL